MGGWEKCSREGCSAAFCSVPNVIACQRENLAILCKSPIILLEAVLFIADSLASVICRHKLRCDTRPALAKRGVAFVCMPNWYRVQVELPARRLHQLMINQKSVYDLIF